MGIDAHAVNFESVQENELYYRWFEPDLMTDAALREKMGKAGRERVVENFDYSVVAKRFVQIIN